MYEKHHPVGDGLTSLLPPAPLLSSRKRQIGEPCVPLETGFQPYFFYGAHDFEETRKKRNTMRVMVLVFVSDYEGSVREVNF
jgi:hypothetical protein